MEPTSPTGSTDTSEKLDDKDEKEVWSDRYTAESFYEPDSEANIILDGENIKAATLPKLIFRLTLGSSGTFFRGS